MTRSKFASLAALLLATVAQAQPGPPAGGLPPGGPPPEGMPPGGPPGGMPPMPSMAETSYTAALSVKDGKIAARDTRAAMGKQFSEVAARGLTITSSRADFNGLIIGGGRSAFTFSDSKIRLSGPGSNDFLGIGAGAMVNDGATLVLNRVDIETSARVSSAVVAAEGATLRIYDSRLVARGGPLPEGYKPRIGPGMLEPPAPLGLKGTARTVLAMSNSRTFIYNSHIEADGWGALSTDATGGNLYLEANDSTVLVKGLGYGVYADFGARVVLRRTKVESGAYQGIIAGAAEIEFDGVSGTAAKSGVMIHSVMAFDPAESGVLTVRNSKLTSGGPVFLVKSANARILVENSTLESGSGMLLEVRKNDDPNATQTRGAKVPGVRLALARGVYRGSIVDTDPDRGTIVSLTGAQLTGSLSDVELNADGKSRWLATGNSKLVLGVGTPLTAIDAAPGTRVMLVSADPAVPTGTRTAPSGGTLEVTRN